MNYLPQVIRAKHVSGFVVATRFDDGTEKQVDISQWFKGPVFKALRESKFFKKFFIEAGTLAWPSILTPNNRTFFVATRRFCL